MACGLHGGMAAVGKGEWALVERSGCAWLFVLDDIEDKEESY